MDERTKLSYLKNAQTFSTDWQKQPPPKDMYGLISKFFVAGGSVADIGCGDGRDAKWLAENKFHPTGYDSSLELIAIARKQNPKVRFNVACFPDLPEIKSTYDNILCETVIMHLPKAEIPTALESLKKITRQNGVIYLSWRVTEGADFRSPDGRLYSAFEPEFVLKHFNQDRILHFEDRLSESSGKRVCRLMYRRQ